MCVIAALAFGSCCKLHTHLQKMLEWSLKGWLCDCYGTVGDGMKIVTFSYTGNASQAEHAWCVSAKFTEVAHLTWCVSVGGCIRIGVSTVVCVGCAITTMTWSSSTNKTKTVLPLDWRFVTSNHTRWIIAWRPTRHCFLDDEIVFVT